MRSLLVLVRISDINNIRMGKYALRSSGGVSAVSIS